MFGVWRDIGRCWSECCVVIVDIYVWDFVVDIKIWIVKYWKLYIYVKSCKLKLKVIKLLYVEIGKIFVYLWYDNSK